MESIELFPAPHFPAPIARIHTPGVHQGDRRTAAAVGATGRVTHPGSAPDSLEQRRTDWLTVALTQALDPDERETVRNAVPLLARLVEWDEHRTS